MHSKTTFKNILCIRPDNMGDVIMSGPAIRALKKTFSARITLLTSKMGSLITPYLSDIDDVIVADLPWVKNDLDTDINQCTSIIQKIQSYQFDLAVIFTVYSQNPLPTAMLAFMAGIPNRLAYCRENPYHLLTHWVPDKEPYNYILHQVQRDLYLVKTIGAHINDDRLRISYSRQALNNALQKIALRGVDIKKKWFVLHPGVSEKKREYPVELWIETARMLQKKLNVQLIITGAEKEKYIAEKIRENAGGKIYPVAGLLSIEEFIAIIAKSLLVISVNTATSHIAAALNVPIIVLYAMTNPQHVPWKTLSEVLPFEVNEKDRSRNEVIRYVNDHLFNGNIPMPGAERIWQAIEKMTSPDLEGEIYTNDIYLSLYPPSSFS